MPQFGGLAKSCRGEMPARWKSPVDILLDAQDPWPEDAGTGLSLATPGDAQGGERLDEAAAHAWVHGDGACERGDFVN